MTQSTPEGIDAKERAVQLLYQHIDRLPHEEYGVINYLPFQHDSEQIRQLKRHVCEAVINLLSSHGCLNTALPEDPPAQEIRILCRNGGDLITRLAVKDGVALVNARNFIETMAGTNPECPHGTMTLDDMRNHMQHQLDIEMAAEEAAEAGDNNA